MTMTKNQLNLNNNLFRSKRYQRNKRNKNQYNKYKGKNKINLKVNLLLKWLKSLYKIFKINNT